MPIRDRTPTITDYLDVLAQVIETTPIEPATLTAPVLPGSVSNRRDSCVMATKYAALPALSARLVCHSTWIRLLRKARG
ncbi:hypothetical protein BDN72DRAFT_837282 [Pluteus cervinus]|uniref:Uncharacterized protein n=1 Tax=Pluteus cervinus TaxID=181527 RepID=A0ACD3B118_9AGAR|nr:hypothetical protein BDN72DRAFT_837282 [Pluteus cervinus]